MKRSSIVAVLVGLVLSAVVAGASAQTSGPVASGHFTGVVTLNGHFTYDVPGGGAVNVFVEGSGPLELELDEGTMSGPFSWSGEQKVLGFFGTSAALFSIEGGGPISASGMLQGPPSGYRMTGTYQSTNTVEVGGPVGGASSTSSDSGPLDEQLTDVIVLCDTIVGRWDLRVKQQIEAAGFDEYIRGYFTASTGVDATEQAEEVEDLVEDVAEWASEAPGLEPGGSGLYMGRALSLLDRSQQLQAELAQESPCPPDPAFTTELALAMQDVLNQLLDLYPGITNDTIVSAAIAAGAIGAGSPAGQTAADLEARMEADINQKFEELVEDWGNAPETETEIVRTARAAQMLGMETIGSGDLSPADVLLVVTGSAT